MARDGIHNNGLTTRIANQWGLAQKTETLHPMEDLQLINFCLGIPLRHYGHGNGCRWRMSPGVGVKCVALEVFPITRQTL